MSSATSVLRIRGIAQLWWASAFFAIATWSVQIAITVQVLRTHSVAALAAIELAGTLPMMIILPFAGACADRFDVRRISLIVMALQVVCYLGIGIVIHGGLVTIGAIYAIQGCLSAFWAPARQQWLYGVIAADARARANAAIGSINGIMTLVGAALGGGLSALGPAVAVYFGAGIQVLSVVVLLRLRKPETPERETETDVPRRMLVDVMDGIRTVKKYPLAGSVVWIGIAWGLIGGGSYTVLLSGHVINGLHGSSTVLGVIFAVDGLCVIVATRLASRLSRARHLTFYGAAYVVQGVAWAFIFATDHLPVTIIALVIMRIASGFVIALDTTILLATVPPQLRGRVASLHMTTYNAFARVSLALVGGLLTVFALGDVGVTAGLVSAGFGLVWWRFSRSTRPLYRHGDIDAQPEKIPVEE